MEETITVNLTAGEIGSIYAALGVVAAHLGLDTEEGKSMMFLANRILASGMSEGCFQ